VPIDVKVELGDGERPPLAVEAAAYYVVAEALTTVARYAHAGVAAVRIGHVAGSRRVEVRDDGVGGADPGAGSGLRGLADRAEALDGSLQVTRNANRRGTASPDHPGTAAPTPLTLTGRPDSHGRTLPNWTSSP
jgi:signal transduction histidine kinase